MKIRTLTALVGLSLAALASLASAQSIGVAPQFSLLMNEKVTKELKISAEQQSSVKEVLQPYMNPDGRSFQIPAGISIEDLDKKCLNVLNAEQKGRLRQLWLQREGEMAAVHPDVAKDLKLTDAQKSSIEQAMNDMREEIRDAIRNPEPDESGRVRSRGLEARDRAKKRISGILTIEQKEELRKMYGEKFDFKVKSE